MKTATLMSGLAVFGVLVAVPAFAAEDEFGYSAADEHYDAEEMAAARRALKHETGGQTNFMLMGDRLEYRSNEGEPVLLWDMQGWFGGDIDKVTVKTEGEYLLDQDQAEGVEVQALYTRTISSYFDVQAGVRHDFRPHPTRSFAVLGVQGLAPYWFEVDGAAFLSADGDLSARFEAEYELLLTQRLILQPRAEFDFSVQDVPELGIGSGLSTVETGLRLRYEVVREFAPYIGVSWESAVGETADIARASGEDVGAVSLVTGIRLWF
jgi:copper resistance protein B